MIDLHDLYWDCSCEEKYIRFATKNYNSHCPECKAFESEQPSSRINEMVKKNMTDLAWKQYKKEILDFKRSIEERDGRKYRLYTAKRSFNFYVMIAGNIGENLDWGVYIDKKPVLRFPNLGYETRLSFEQAKEKAMELLHEAMYGGELS